MDSFDKERGLSLLDAFSEVEEGRSPHGMRYKKEFLLVLVTMAIMSKCHTRRQMAKFGKRHLNALNSLFDLDYRKSPSLSCISKFLNVTPFESLIQAFNTWASVHGYTGKAKDVIPIDGKRLGGHENGLKKDGNSYINIVTAFSAREKTCISVTVSEGKGNGKEPQAVRQLVEGMESEGNLYTLDALHAQKKH